MYHVVYSDGDEEDLYKPEMLKWLVEKPVPKGPIASKKQTRQLLAKNVRPSMGKTKRMRPLHSGNTTKPKAKRRALMPAGVATKKTKRATASITKHTGNRTHSRKGIANRVGHIFYPRLSFLAALLAHVFTGLTELAPRRPY